jgi:ribonuclease HI
MIPVTIYSDGASRGNPGQAGAGAVINVEGESKSFELAEFLGKKTNNEAEYQALILALKKTKQLLGKSRVKQAQVTCYADSELMVKQLNHQYKIKNTGIQPLFLEIWNLMLDFREVQVRHVPREQNREADQLANKAINKQLN